MSEIDNKLKVYGDFHKQIDFKVVTRHALADEENLLNQLNMTPKDCLICDLYWKFENKLFLVSISSTKLLNKRPRAKYYFDPEEKEFGSFSVIVNEDYLSISTVNSVLKDLGQWIQKNPRLVSQKTNKAIYIKKDNASTKN